VLSAKSILFLLLGVFTAAFCGVWAMDLTRRQSWRWPSVFNNFVGFVTDFLDTLGIGSYATTTSLFRVRQTVADEDIPGTLTIGHTIPTITEAFIYITIVEVEMKTLVLMIAASVLGGWLGANVVTRLPRQPIRIGMGLALLTAAALMLGQLLALFPGGGDALFLDGLLLAAGLVGNFVFGALMTIGIGAYAPIMIMVSLLGMSPKTAFPIMMGSCAFLMPVAAARFIRKAKYDTRAALGLTLGGIPGVLIAAFIVTSMPLGAVRWLVLAVVLYTAASILRAARAERLARGNLSRPLQATDKPDMDPNVAPSV
jgi:uncharacterized membrane protein YfcA